ncbi:MAG: coiled-coil protein [Candidatus Thorarchaeota archaeon]
MSIDEKKLDELEAQAAELRNTRNELFNQIKKLREERDRLNKTARAARDQAQKHRGERDRINSKVQEIKQSLGPLFDDLSEKNQTLAQANRAIREEYKGLPNKKQVQEDLKRIEWEVMTTPTKEMLGREDELIQRAADLRKTLDEFKGIEQKQDKKQDYLKDRKDTLEEINALREEINGLAEKSQEHHERMILFYEQADKDKKRADEVHGRYVEKIKEVENIKGELNIIMPDINAMRDGLKASDLKHAELRKMNVKQRAEAMKQAAIKKMENGEKLTFEDMKLIYGDEDED